MPANSILDGPITALLSILCILIELEVLPCALATKVKSLNDFKFGTSVGRFLIDGAASTAVKGLNMLQLGFCCKIVSASCGCNLFYCWTCSSFTFVSCYCLSFFVVCAELQTYSSFQWNQCPTSRRLWHGAWLVVFTAGKTCCVTCDAHYYYS